MFILLRILPKSFGEMYLAFQRLRRQTDDTRQFGTVTVFVMIVVAVWTFVSDRREQKNSDKVREATWKEALNG